MSNHFFSFVYYCETLRQIDLTFFVFVCFAFFIGVLTEQGVSAENPASIYACVLFGLNCLLFVVKVVVNCIKAKRRTESYGILDYGYDMASI